MLVNMRLFYNLSAGTAMLAMVSGDEMPDFGSMGDMGDMGDMGGMGGGMPDLSALGDMGGMGGMGGMPGMEGLDFSQMGGMGGMGGQQGQRPVPKGPVKPVGQDEVTDNMTDEERETLDKGTEVHDFQAETSRLMDIIINSLYAGKDIFLRELISNAADALERARFLALDGGSESSVPLEIKIDFDKEAQTIAITDSGVGMTKEELVENLGTIAKSGTTNFLEALSKSGDMNLIGQFGVGFYSAFLVSDQVVVTSKSAESDQYIWRSAADGRFSVSQDPRGNTIKQGSRITLHLKQDALDLLDESKLKELVQKYSQFIQYPIYIKTSKTVEEEVDVEDEDKEDDVSVDDTEDKKKEKVKKEIVEWEQVNVNKPIWLRPRDEIAPVEYNEFYKTLNRDWDAPLAHIHFNAEGEIEFKCILYIPKKAPNDMFENYFQKQSLIKLYVRRVLVADNFDGLLPKYLSFISGIVDSDDLPLNVSREQLQQQHIIKVIKKKLERKVLDLIKKMSQDFDSLTSNQKDLKELEEKYPEPEEEKKEDEGEEAAKERYSHVPEEDRFKMFRLEDNIENGQKYRSFYKEFGRTIKLGCYEDDQNRAKIAKTLRFKTSRSSMTNEDDDISLDTYIKNMKSEQKNKIYYASGENIQQLMRIPAIQIFLKKDIQVLLFTDPMDESCIQRLTEYSGKKFASIQKGNIDFDQTDVEKARDKQYTAYYKDLIAFLKKQTENVSSVVISKRLVDAPVAVVTSEYGYSPYMEKMMKVQTIANQDNLKMMMGSRILEINPNHRTIHKLRQMIADNPESPTTIALGKSLIDAATFASGYDVEDPAQLAKYMFKQIDSHAQQGSIEDSDADADVLVDQVAFDEEFRVEEERIAAEKAAKEEEKRKKREEKERIEQEKRDAEKAQEDTADSDDAEESEEDVMDDEEARDEL